MDYLEAIHLDSYFYITLTLNILLLKLFQMEKVMMNGLFYREIINFMKLNLKLLMLIYEKVMFVMELILVFIDLVYVFELHNYRYY